MIETVRDYQEDKVDQEELKEILVRVRGLLNKYRFDKEEINRELQGYTKRARQGPAEKDRYVVI
jgi:hypothetical protein